MSGYGQEASTDLAPGRVAMGTKDPAVIDPMTAGNYPLEEAQRQVAAAEAALRTAQQRYMHARQQLDELEADEEQP